MTIDDLLSRARIEFPESLDLQQTKKMLLYLANDMPARVTYQITSFASIDKLPEDDIAKYEEGSFSIGGTITCMHGNYAFDSFQSETSREDLRIGAIVFSLIPGYTLEQHRPEIVELWDSTKASINKYFEQK